jgi:hypothetical protein
MDSKSAIKGIVADVMSDAIEYVGTDDADAAMEGALKGKGVDDLFAATPGGANMDLGEALSLIVAATTLANNLFDLLGRRNSKLSDEERDEIAKRVLEQIREESNQ